MYLKRHPRAATNGNAGKRNANSYIIARTLSVASAWTPPFIVSRQTHLGPGVQLRAETRSTAATRPSDPIDCDHAEGFTVSMCKAWERDGCNHIPCKSMLGNELTVFYEEIDPKKGATNE